jgi:hypothetical protein
MTMLASPFLILVVVALILAVVSLIPQLSNWPILGVSVLLLAVALLILHP